jgi:DNA polymerase-3 subunit delta
MSTISYKDIKKYLAERGEGPFAPVYLIFGEDMLTKNCFDELLNALLPASKRSINYDPLDGTQENIHTVIERVNTFSLLPGAKVTALRDSRIFYARQDKDRILDNAKTAYQDDNIKKASGYLLSLMGFLNLTFEDLDTPNREKSLGRDNAAGADDAWLDEIIAYCREKGLSIPSARDDSRILQQAVENGFPQNNHLIITTDMVDKRRGLFKTLTRKGVVVDCSVPKGDRQADRIVKESVLVEKMNAILGAGKKTMNQATYTALYEMTGFDLRTFANNLEKLISYVGDREEITIEDVKSVLQRTKTDPIYELTNALADRSADRSLFFLTSLLSSDIHPLQVFAALINQIRKLLLVKDFVESPYGNGWQAACPYNYFQKHIIPAIVEYDRRLLDEIGSWQDMLKTHKVLQDGSEIRPKMKKSKTATDLIIAKNPKNAYPIYQLFKKSERFSKKDLLKAVESLNAADKRLKSGSQKPKLVLEKVILGICRTEKISDPQQGAEPSRGLPHTSSSAGGR